MCCLTSVWSRVGNVRAPFEKFNESQTVETLKTSSWRHVRRNVAPEVVPGTIRARRLSVGVIPLRKRCTVHGSLLRSVCHRMARTGTPVRRHSIVICERFGKRSAHPWSAGVYVCSLQGGEETFGRLVAGLPDSEFRKSCPTNGYEQYRP